MPCIRATVENPSGGEVSYSLLSASPPDFADNINFTPSDRVVNLIAVQTTPVNASIYIRATTATEQATLVLQLAAVDPPAIVAALGQCIDGSLDRRDVLHRCRYPAAPAPIPTLFSLPTAI